MVYVDLVDDLLTGWTECCYFPLFFLLPVFFFVSLTFQITSKWACIMFTLCC